LRRQGIDMDRLMHDPPLLPGCLQDEYVVDVVVRIEAASGGRRDVGVRLHRMTQFVDRLPLRPYREAGTDLMPSPIKPIGEALPVPTIAAREPGRDTDEVLAKLLGYDAERIAALRRSGALG